MPGHVLKRQLVEAGLADLEHKPTGKQVTEPFDPKKELERRKKKSIKQMMAEGGGFTTIVPVK